MSPAELVADCIAAGRHFARIVIYTGEQIPRCHMCGCPRGWRPPARRITTPTGRPVTAHGPTCLPGGPDNGSARAFPMALFAAARGRTQPCGTPAGYHRHLRHGQPACDACRTAHSTVMTADARRRRATRAVAA